MSPRRAALRAACCATPPRAWHPRPITLNLSVTQPPRPRARGTLGYIPLAGFITARHAPARVAPSPKNPRGLNNANKYVIIEYVMDTSSHNNTITVNTALYGPLAKYGGGKYIAEINVALEHGDKIEDLLKYFELPPDEKSYLFINAVLCDVPGLYASQRELLHDGDHVGIFSLQHMWPYQYRDGIRMSDSLTEALEEHGPIKNTY